jgi:hypothetical protein
MWQRVLVCGGRDYSNQSFLNAILDGLHAKHNFTHMAHGAARGADSLAGTWALLHGLTVCEFPADWEREGKAAGLLRNERMFRTFVPELVVAFPGGRGTAHMIGIAKRANCPLIQIVA